MNPLDIAQKQADEAAERLLNLRRRYRSRATDESLKERLEELSVDRGSDDDVREAEAGPRSE